MGRGGVRDDTHKKNAYATDGGGRGVAPDSGNHDLSLSRALLSLRCVRRRDVLGHAEMR